MFMRLFYVWFLGVGACHAQIMWIHVSSFCRKTLNMCVVEKRDGRMIRRKDDRVNFWLCGLVCVCAWNARTTRMPSGVRFLTWCGKKKYVRAIDHRHYVRSHVSDFTKITRTHSVLLYAYGGAKMEKWARSPLLFFFLFFTLYWQKSHK